MGRRQATLLVLVLMAGMIAAGRPALATSSAESQFISMINSARASHGLPALSVRSDLTAVARRHSARMASQQTIYHNPSLGSDVDGWTDIGENVGRGRTVEKIHDAFMASSYHRANILWSKPNQLGVGVATARDGRFYVTEIFVNRRGGGSAPPAPAPARTSSGVSSAARAASVAAQPAIHEKPFTVSMLAELVRLG